MHPSEARCAVSKARPCGPREGCCGRSGAAWRWPEDADGLLLHRARMVGDLILAHTFPRAYDSATRGQGYARRCQEQARESGKATTCRKGVVQGAIQGISYNMWMDRRWLDQSLRQRKKTGGDDVGQVQVFSRRNKERRLSACVAGLRRQMLAIAGHTRCR